MAASIYRIMPPTVAPDRVMVASRERGDNGRGAEGRERETERAAPEQRVQESAPKDQLKGNRLDISV